MKGSIGGKKMASFKRGLVIMLAFLIMVAFMTQNSAQAVSGEWEQVSPFPTANSISAVAYGNNKFVAVGRNQVIITSTDSKNWIVSDHPQAVNSNLASIIYGNGRFVAVGSSGLIVTLVDGETQWKIQRQNITSYAITSVVFANGKFVAVGANGIVMTSTDGITWTGQPVTSTYHMGVTYGKNKFVGVGQRGSVIQSADGTTWSTATVNNTYMFNGVTYGNNKFVAVGQGGLIATSSDGNSWTTAISNSTVTFNTVTYDNLNNLYVAVGGGGTIVTSANGTNWTVQTTGTIKDLNGVFARDGLIFAVGYSGVILTSNNGMTWTDQLRGTAAGLESLTYGNGIFVAAGYEMIGSTSLIGAIYTSEDGQNWVNRKKAVFPYKRDYISSVSYGNGKFIAVGYKELSGLSNTGLIMTSSNGVSWTEQLLDEGTLLDSVYGDHQYVTVGAFGKIMTSPDGETWTSRTSGVSVPLTDISYGNGLYVAVGGSTVVTSPDGVTWKEQPSDSSRYIYDIAYGNGLFIAVGQSGKIITSSNGENWSTVTSTVNNVLQGIHYDMNGFKATGNSGVLLTSPDGITWTKQISGTKVDLRGSISSGSEDVVIGLDGLILRKSVMNSTIDPTTASFDKNSSSADYKDIETEVVLNGNEFTGIENGAEKLVLDSDYKMVAGTVTIRKEYLVKQAEGTIDLNFTFSTGATQKLVVTINNTTPKVVTVSYLQGEHGTIDGTSEQVEIGGHPVNVPTVTPAKGYHFAGWSSDGGITKLSSHEVGTSTVTANVTYTAQYTVFVMGDADGDGKVTAADALLLTKYMKGKITLTPEQLHALDMNGDGKWDDEDVKAILAIAIGKG